ncbi:MAG: 23S rRNA (adenine(2030)-N(6))-methyltransferase RlmJ [Rhodospirillum sp.]|nr:23S rRNA (adenine(2030)-N(6))-methyltransferase RlmJ [Rhodospirillum sp.]MCF8488432.1 23S rRNA (adenine(2030)-N(6))-methyltransferase RlmJ [Rhodospirillum sp.]
MNYDHAYHAGNFADVLKHAILTIVLNHLKRKDKSFVVVDTHGGQGAFDLSDPRVRRTGEAQEGILRLLSRAGEPPEVLRPYLDAVLALGHPLDQPLGGASGDGNGGLLRRYPGSPLLTRHLIRPQDRLVTAELHPAHGDALRATLRGWSRTHVEAKDGYETLKAHVPPPERRGLVLIDPPFERADEFQTLVRSMRAALRRWAQGIYMIWYPIKDPTAVDAFHADLRTLSDSLTAPVPAIVAELWVRPRFPPLRLNGTGLVVFNPPHGLLQALPELMPWLRESLAEPGRGEDRWFWLIEERKAGQ